MFGVPRVLPPLRENVGLCPLLMIIPVSTWGIWKAPPGKGKTHRECIEVHTHSDWVVLTKLYSDNKLARSIANNSRQYDRTKHVEIWQALYKRDTGPVSVFHIFHFLYKFLMFSPKGYSSQVFSHVLASWVWLISMLNMRGSVGTRDFVDSLLSRGTLVFYFTLNFLFFSVLGL